MLSRLFTPWHGAATGAQPAHVNPTLDSCTGYPSLLGGQRQCRMRSLPKAPTHDQCRESALLKNASEIDFDNLSIAIILKALPDSFQSFTAVITQRKEPHNLTFFKVALRTHKEILKMNDSTVVNVMALGAKNSVEKNSLFFICGNLGNKK